MDTTFTYLATLSRTVLSRSRSDDVKYSANEDEQTALQVLGDLLNGSVALQTAAAAAAAAVTFAEEAAELGKRITAQMATLEGLRAENRELQLRVAAELAARLAAAHADPGLVSDDDRAAIVAALENVHVWSAESDGLAQSLPDVVSRVDPASAMALDGSVVGAWKQVVAILDLMEELALQMKKALLECRMVIVDGKFM